MRYVLEGSVRKGGNRVRVTAQLIDAVSGAHVWAERYDRDLSDIFAVQDEITASVAGVIEPALAEAEQQRVLRKPPDRLDAWEAYQRGLWHFYKYSPEDNQIALDFLPPGDRARPEIRARPLRLCAGAAMGDLALLRAPLRGGSGTPRDEAHIAVSLDDKDAMAHAVLAHMMMWGGEWEASDCRSPHRVRAQSKQRVCDQHARLRAWVWRVPRGSARPAAAGDARQPARSVDLAVDDVERGHAVFRTQI